jgi:hypothetical protein
VWIYNANNMMSAALLYNFTSIYIKVLISLSLAGSRLPFLAASRFSAVTLDACQFSLEHSHASCHFLLSYFRFKSMTISSETRVARYKSNKHEGYHERNF